MTYYLECSKTNIFLFERDKRLWKPCQKYPQYCWNSKFLTSFCKLFPLQSMKLIRIRLALAEKLLADESLNVRILLLVRDPRATMQSRKNHKWCPGNPDCDYVPNLCMGLVSDYAAAEHLLKKYPTRFRTLRYEDLALNSYNVTQIIVQFFGLPFDPLVEDFLYTHTKFNSGTIYSTFRDSKSAPFHWIKDLKWLQIQFIELSCQKAMSLWGYRQFKRTDNLTSAFDQLMMSPPFT